MKPTAKDTIRTALVTAFTIAAALIWKDVIVEVIEILVPSGEELFFKIVSAIVATVLVVLAISLALKTESEAETLIAKIEGLIEHLRHREKNIPPVGRAEDDSKNFKV